MSILDSVVNFFTSGPSGKHSLKRMYQEKNGIETSDFSKNGASAKIHTEECGEDCTIFSHIGKNGIKDRIGK